MKNEIASKFGDDVFDAVAASHTWDQNAEETGTTCIKVDVYPGLVMVISLTISWTPCFQFVKLLYRL